MIYLRIDNIEILDKYTVRFHLKTPDPYMLMKLTNFHGGFIVSKKAREKLGKMFKTEPVGTGPFELVEYRPKDKLTPDRGTLSVDKAKKLLGYEPQWPLEKGFGKYIEWYKALFKRYYDGKQELEVLY